MPDWLVIVAGTALVIGCIALGVILMVVAWIINRWEEWG